MDENQNAPAKTSKSKGPLPQILGIVGFILGVPISYYFQPGIIRVKFTCGQYVSNLPDMIRGILKHPDDVGIQVLVTLVLSCVVLSVIGGLIGRAINK